jgi:hypothetical protein
MNVGMLWFDNDNKSDLPTKVTRAATYYHGKYGVQPNICFVHPSMAVKLDADKPKSKLNKSGEIEVRLTKTVLPHHFWIGIHQQETNPAT